MKMKRKILIGMLVLTFLFLAIPAIIPQSQASVSDDIQVDVMYNWTIVKFDLQGGVVDWKYPWYGASKGNFTANISNVLNPVMNFTVSSISGDDIIGNISIGNITVTDANQTEIGIILNLNHWSMSQPIGLIIPNSTDDVKTAFINADTGTYEKWNVTENNKYIMFEIKDVSIYGSQITTLVYEKSSGILVFADTYVNFGIPNHYIIGEMPNMNTVSSDIQVGLTFNWTIYEFDLNGGVINWLYPWNGVSKGNFTANISGTLNPAMNLTITNIVGAEINGTIEIGNITITNVNQTEIGAILGLGNYNFNIGLIIPNSTDRFKAEFLAANPVTNYDKWDVTEYKNLIMFEIEFHASYGDQIITLIYNKTSGLLLFADIYLDFGTPNHYIIGIKLNMSDPIPPIPGFEIILIFSIIGLTVFGYWSIKKRNSKEKNYLAIQN